MECAHCGNDFPSDEMTALTVPHGGGFGSDRTIYLCSDGKAQWDEEMAMLEREPPTFVDIEGDAMGLSEGVAFLAYP